MPKSTQTGYGGGTKRSHFELTKALRGVGKTMGVRRVYKKRKVRLRVKPNPEHKDDFFRAIFEKYGTLDIKKLKNTSFGGRYRKIWDAQDELLSTSSVRELMKGVLEAHQQSALSDKAIENLNTVFNNISRVRIPTKYSGYAIKGEKMQHPTAAGEGYFAEASATSRQHSEMDRARRQAVTEEMEAEIKKKGATLESIANAGLRRAITFTLNEFTAPLSASDVQPYAKKGKAPKSKIDEQLQTREYLKAVAVNLGATQESDNGASAATRRGRSWTRRRNKGKRDVSPPRF